jgi:serine/threonine protein kinase
MELVDGIDLETLVRGEGPLPPGRARNILVQIAEALGEAHDRGLVHRDVKPANVMLSRRGRTHDFVKVLDFGLVKELGAKAESSLSSGESLTGTPIYLSPEAIRAPGTVDGRSDLYALGAVAYFLLTGSPPFTGTNLVEVCGKHLHATPEPPSSRVSTSIPPALEALVLECLAKSPAERPQDAFVVAARLRACADVTPWPPDEAERWWKERAPLLRRSHEPAVTGESQTVAIDFAARS